MEEEIKKLVKGAQTDIQAVVEILERFKEFKLVDLRDDLGYGSSLPIQFNIYKNEEGEIVEEGLGETTKYNLAEIKERVFFADLMYKLGLHGACSSRSSLRGAMFRAAGLKERTVLAIPLVYYYESDGTIIKLKDKYNVGYPDVTGSSLIADHFFNEVFLGNQWIKVDYDIDTGIFIYNRKPCIKILTCHDQTDYNFREYWNYDTWQEKRPYKYISVIDMEAKYIE